MYKYVKKNLKDINKNFNTHGHEMRQKENLHVWKIRTSAYVCSTINTAVKIYNSLSHNVKIIYYPLFCKTLKAFLLDRCYYSLTEFLGHLKNKMT